MNNDTGKEREREREDIAEQDTHRMHKVTLLPHDDMARMEVATLAEMEMLRTALRKSPIQWLGLNVIPKITHAYHTGVNGVYLIFVDYGGHNLNGVVIVQDIELRVWFDFGSIMQVTRAILEGEQQE